MPSLSKIGENPEKIMRLPSNGISPSASKRGSSIIAWFALSRAALSGYSIHEKTTF